MKDYLDIPLSKLCGISYSNQEHKPDKLEWAFITEISKNTGFYMMGIHIIKAYKSKYSRRIDCFEFEFEGKKYILEKGKIKEGSI